MQDVFHAKFCEWDSMGKSVQDSLAPAGTGLLPQPFCAPKPTEAIINPSPQATEKPVLCVAYLMACPMAQN